MFKIHGMYLKQHTRNKHEILIPSYSFPYQDAQIIRQVRNYVS